jgi:signal transduction histidine kinase/CheY-like chemotaxis protein
VGEFENLKKNGERLLERATLAPVRDTGGVLTNYIAIKEDITHLRQNEEKRRSLEAQLHQSQKLESLGSLAGGVAHDMNNVLGAILGLASTLRETADDASPAARSFDTIVNACLRGRGVVKSLLYFARKDLLEEQAIDLNALVEEMVQLLGSTSLKRITIETELEEGLGWVLGDAGALSHALMNLCVNAMDAMPTGGTMRILSESDGEDVLLRVRDTGSGMAPEVLAKARDPFFTTKLPGKGTGLGLSMVYGTMKAHEGDFELTSQLGQGTEATLRFPASRVEHPAKPLAGEASSTTAVAEGRRVLLVDDDELIRDSVAPMLEVLGHQVTTAASGEAALQLLQTDLVLDLMILDMNMPGLGGADVLPLALGARPGLHVVMATGYSDQEIAPLLRDRPRVSSLRKPFTMRELQAKIDSLQFG